MTSSDVDDVARLINQLHPDQPGVIRPERGRQGWRALVARNDEGGAVEFLLGRSSATGWLTKSAGMLEQLVIDESVHGQSIGTELVERWKSWLIAEGVPLGFASTGPDAVGFYEQCGFPTLHRTLARVGSRMRPIQALYSAGGDADSVRELSVTATGRCPASDRSAAAATRAVIRPSSR